MATSTSPTGDVVLHALQSSMEGKEEARYQLELWQKERVPGFLQVLVDLVARREDVSVELRMYAAIIAKNKIGAQWTRSQTTSFGGSFAEKKGWALISDEEKENLKSRLLQLLFSEPEERVVVQLIILVSGVARYDYPSGWPTLLSQLLGVPREENFRERILALRTIKSILQALKGKKSLLSVTDASLLRDRAKLHEFAKNSQQEMKRMLTSIASCFPQLLQTWRTCSALFGAGAEQWEGAGELTNCSLSCIRQMLLVLESFNDVSQMGEFFTEAAVQAGFLKNVYIRPPSDSHAAANVPLWCQMASKTSLLINKCCIAAIDKHARLFAPMMIPFMQVYLESIMALDYAALKVIDQKRLVLMTRFLAKILHNPAYKRPNRVYVQSNNVNDALQKASRSIWEFFQGPILPQFVEALITKFLLLTEEELEEWEADPENYFLTSNLDLDIESEVRRCCAEALLLFLMERNVETTSRVVLTLASQAAQNNDPASLGLTEACFHAIDVTAPLIPTGTLSYDSFFASDLVKYLDMPSNNILVRIMQGRVLHLLVTFSAELSAESYEKALMASLKFLQSPDIVLALYSVKLLHKLCLAEIVGKGAYADVHSRLLKTQASSVVTSSIQTASKLVEAETLQMVLKLIAVEVEALVDQNSLEIIQILAVYIPQLWQTILSFSEREVGLGAPCQSSLINIVLLLIEKVGDVCLAILPLKEVIFQLIGFCVNVGATHAAYLLEDGLKLWRTVLLYGSWTSIGESVHNAAGNLFSIIQSGKENHEALCILKIYIILCGSQIMSEHEQLIKLLVEHCLSDKGTVKEAFGALDFLYTATLLDPELSYRISQQAIVQLARKYASRNQSEVTRTLLDPLLSIITLLVVRQESLLKEFAHGMVDELLIILLSFKGLRSVQEFLAVPRARTAGRVKRKVAVVLLGFIVKYYPETAKKHKKNILQFGVSQVHEENVQKLSVEDLMDAKAGLTQSSEKECWNASEYYKKTKVVYSSDPLFSINLRDFVAHTAELIMNADNSENSAIEALLTNMSNISM